MAAPSATLIAVVGYNLILSVLATRDQDENEPFAVSECSERFADDRSFTNFEVLALHRIAGARRTDDQEIAGINCPILRRGFYRHAANEGQ